MKKNFDFSSMSAVEAGYRRRQRKSTVITLVLAVLVLMLAAFMMLYGNKMCIRDRYERMQKIDIGYKIGMESLELLRQQSLSLIHI